MILPKGKIKHRDLMTSYTDLPALLSTLKAEGFSGTIEIEFPEKRGVLFVDSGEIINAEANSGDAERMTGVEAVQYLLNLANQKDGVLNIHQFMPEQVAILASSLDCEILFKELSTDFTRLDRLLLKLKEEGHEGFIEVFSKDHHPLGVLFLQGGDPAEMFTLSKSGPSLFGRKAIPPFVENAARDGAILNVYRSRGKALKPEAPAKPEIPAKEEVRAKEEATAKEEIQESGELIPILQEVLSKAEAWVDGNSKKGRFSGTFKKCLIEKSGEYPFLDPFRGEFEYREGVVHFKGDADFKDLMKGIVACLEETFSILEKELAKGKTSPMKLRMEIESTYKVHREAVKRLGIENEITGIFQVIASASR